MEALLASGFPVGVTVLIMAAVVLAMLAVLTALHIRAPAVATPTVVISFFMLLTFVVVAIYSTLRQLPESKASELLLGALISGFTIVLTFWFGKGGGPSGPPPE